MKSANVVLVVLDSSRSGSGIIMSRLVQNALALVGDTPLVRLGRVAATGAAVWGKLEAANPGGSVKDRIALAMVEEAEHAGLIKPGDTLVEPTSGNTGVGL